nr:MFS transporter [Nocardia sp. NRRL WC-3656]
MDALIEMMPLRNRLAAELGVPIADISGAEGMRRLDPLLTEARDALAAALGYPTAGITPVIARDILGEAVGDHLNATNTGQFGIGNNTGSAAAVSGPASLAARDPDRQAAAARDADAQNADTGDATDGADAGIIAAASQYLATAALLDLVVQIHRRSPNSRVNNTVTGMRVLCPDNARRFEMPATRLGGHGRDVVRRVFGAGLEKAESLEQVAESLKFRPGGISVLVYKWKDTRASGSADADDHMVLLVNDSDSIDEPNLVVVDLAVSRDGDTANDYGPKDLRNRRALLNKAVGFDEWRREQKKFIDRMPVEKRLFETIEFDRDGNLVTRSRTGAPTAESLPPSQQVVAPNATVDGIDAVFASLPELGGAMTVRSGTAGSNDPHREEREPVGARPSENAANPPSPSTRKGYPTEVLYCVPWVSRIIRALGNDDATAEPDPTKRLPGDLEKNIRAGLQRDENLRAGDPVRRAAENLVRDPTADTAVIVVGKRTRAHAYVLTDVNGTVYIYDTLIAGGRHRMRVFDSDTWKPGYPDPDYAYHATFHNVGGRLVADTTPDRTQVAIEHANQQITGPFDRLRDKWAHSFLGLERTESQNPPVQTASGSARFGRFKRSGRFPGPGRRSAQVAAQDDQHGRSIRKLLRDNRLYRLVTFNSFTTDFGDELMQQMMPLLIAPEYGTTWAGAVGFASQLPHIAAQPVAGYLAERDPWKMMRVSQLLGLGGATAATIWIGIGAPQRPTVLIATSALEAVAAAVYGASAERMRIELAGPERALANSALTNMMQRFPRLASFAIGPAMLGIARSLPAGANAASYSWNLATLSRLRKPDIPVTPKTAKIKSLRQRLHDIAAGVHTVRKDRILLEDGITLGLVNVFFGFQKLEISSMIIDGQATGIQAAAILLATPIGGIFGSWLGGRKWLEKFSIDTVLTGRLLGVAGAAVLLPATSQPAAVGLGLAGTQILIGAAATRIGAYRYKTVPQEVRGRVAVVNPMIGKSGFAIGGLLGGVLLSRLGMDATGAIMTAAFGGLAGGALVRQIVRKVRRRRLPNERRSITPSAITAVGSQQPGSEARPAVDSEDLTPHANRDITDFLADESAVDRDNRNRPVRSGVDSHTVDSNHPGNARPETQLDPVELPEEVRGCLRWIVDILHQNGLPTRPLTGRKAAHFQSATSAGLQHLPLTMPTRSDDPMRQAVDDLRAKPVGTYAVAIVGKGERAHAYIIIRRANLETGLTNTYIHDQLTGDEARPYFDWKAAYVNPEHAYIAYFEPTEDGTLTADTTPEQSELARTFDSDITGPPTPDAETPEPEPNPQTQGRGRKEVVSAAHQPTAPLQNSTADFGQASQKAANSEQESNTSERSPYARPSIPAEEPAESEDAAGTDPDESNGGERNDSLVRLIRLEPYVGVRIGAEFLTNTSSELLATMTSLYYMENGGAEMAGLVAAATNLVYTAGALIGGHLGDHVAPKGLMTGTLAFAAASDITATIDLASGSAYTVPVLIGTTLVNAGAAVLYTIVADNLLIGMVGNAQLGWNRLNNLKVHTTRVLGNLLAPSALGTGAWSAPLLSLGANVVNLMTVRQLPDFDNKPKSNKKQGILESIVEGARSAKDSPNQIRTMANFGATNAYLGLQGLQLTSLLTDSGLPHWQQGVALLITPLGGVIGNLIPKRWVEKTNIETLLTINLAGLGGPAILAASTMSPWVASAGLSATWAALGMAGPPIRTYMNNATPPEVRARVRSIGTVVNRGAVALGPLVAGGTIGLFGNQTAGISTAVAFGTLASWSLYRRLFKARRLLDCINQTSEATWALGLKSGIKPRKWQKSPEHLRRAIATQLVEIEPGIEPVGQVIENIRNLEGGADTAVVLLDDGKKMQSLTVANTDNKPGGNVIIFDTNITNPEDPHFDPSDPDRIPRVRAIDEYKQFYPDIEEAFVAYLTTDQEDNLTNLRPHNPNLKAPRKDGKVLGSMRVDASGALPNGIAAAHAGTATASPRARAEQPAQRLRGQRRRLRNSAESSKSAGAPAYDAATTRGITRAIARAIFDTFGIEVLGLDKVSVARQHGTGRLDPAHPAGPVPASRRRTRPQDGARHRRRTHQRRPRPALPHRRNRRRILRGRRHFHDLLVLAGVGAVGNRREAPCQTVV